MNVFQRPPIRLDAHSSDDALLAAVAVGDRSALGFLYARHARALRAVARAALPRHDGDSAEDVVQHVFLSLLEGAAATFQPARGRALTWLKGMTRREAAQQA